MRYAALLALLLALAACSDMMPGVEPAALSGPEVAPGAAWSFAEGPASATLGGVSPRIAATCRTNSAGIPVVVWTVDSPAADGAGETLTLSAGALRTAVSLTGVQGTDGSYIWQGGVAPTDNSRQIFGVPAPVTLSLTNGTTITAPEGGPVADVYRACTT